MIVYLPGAMRDLRGIARWYASHRPEGEARFFSRLRATVALIEEQPSMFPLVPEAGGVRKARVLRTPYSIAFVVHGSEQRVVAVIHGARRPGFWMERPRR
jgi:plasmid stabilization system protein ParE